MMKTIEEKLQAKRDYYYANREKILLKQKETKKAWYEKNKEYLKEVSKQWNKDNKEKIAVKRSNLSEKAKINRAKAQARWRANNRDKANALKAKRRCELINATPSWVDDTHLKDIESVYICSKLFSMYTGEKYHVDHIIPLKGKNVSGLHVYENLQILPAKENMRKNNSFTDFII